MIVRFGAFSLIALIATPALADEASGTVTGEVQARVNYYLEDSTRVIAPEVQLRLFAPQGTEVRAHYLVDTITSASIAAGSLDDNRFTEVRHDITIGALHEFELRRSQLEIDTRARVSSEPDWLSAGLRFATRLYLANRATMIRVGLHYLYDDIRQNFRGGLGITPMGTGTTSNQAFRRSANSGALSLGWRQIVTPTLVTDVTYDVAYQAGYLANPYRTVLFLGIPALESHPSTRVRNTLSGRIAWYIPQSKTSLQAYYRAYLDSWDISAINPEVRIYQQASRSIHFRMRYRYYQQTSSFFYRGDPNDYMSGDAYFTADPKMSAFQSHELGGQMLILGKFLGATKLEKLREATLDLTFDYRWNTNAFGNGILAMVGAMIPF